MPKKLNRSQYLEALYRVCGVGSSADRSSTDHRIAFWESRHNISIGELWPSGGTLNPQATLLALEKHFVPKENGPDFPSEQEILIEEFYRKNGVDKDPEARLRWYKASPIGQGLLENPATRGYTTAKKLEYLEYYVIHHGHGGDEE